MEVEEGGIHVQGEFVIYVLFYIVITLIILF